MLKLEPSSPATVSDSPTLISSPVSPFVNLAPDARAISAELDVSEMSLNTGSLWGNVPAMETSWVRPLTSSLAEVGVVPVEVPVPPVEVPLEVPLAVGPPENGSLPGKTLKFVS